MSRLRSLETTEWALKSDARKALDELERAGWDRDLALVTLESAVGADSLYSIEDDEEVL